MAFCCTPRSVLLVVVCSALLFHSSAFTQFSLSVLNGVNASLPLDLVVDGARVLDGFSTASECVHILVPTSLLDAHAHGAMLRSTIQFQLTPFDASNTATNMSFRFYLVDHAALLSTRAFVSEPGSAIAVPSGWRACAHVCMRSVA